MIKINIRRIIIKATPSLHSSKITLTHQISMALRNSCKRNRQLTSRRVILNRASNPINNPHKHINSLRKRIRNRVMVLRIYSISNSKRVKIKLILISKTRTSNRQKLIRIKTNSWLMWLVIWRLTRLLKTWPWRMQKKERSMQQLTTPRKVTKGISGLTKKPTSLVLTNKRFMIRQAMRR